MKVCRILLQVQNIRFLNHVLGCTAAGEARRRAAGLLPAPYLFVVTLQICGLIIVVDIDLVILASLSRVKKSGRIQY